MATFQQRNERLSQVNQVLQQLSESKAEQLVRSELGVLGFKDRADYITEVLGLVEIIRSRRLTNLPLSMYQQLVGGLQPAINTFNRLRAFDPRSSSNPNTDHKQLVDELENLYDSVFGSVWSVICYTSLDSAELVTLRSELQRAVEAARAQVAEAQERAKLQAADLKKTTDEFRAKADAAVLQVQEQASQVGPRAEQALRAIEDQAARAGVSAQAIHFAEEAKVHATAARKWFWATVAMSFFTGLTAVVAVAGAFLYTPPSVATAIQIVTAKILLLSVLTFVVVWCGRNYRAHRHNETLNRHRANALSTFTAFVAGTGDVRVKDAILLHAAQAAFGERATGFEAGDGDGHSTVNPVIEVLGRTVGQTDKAS